MLGAAASVASGARNHAEWAWLTGRRVAQWGMTPLHSAAQNGHEAAIKALVAAKADVNAKDQVRYGRRGGAEREKGVGVGSVVY
jgi:hypothetical protein